jgi:hypothetical protein
VIETNNWKSPCRFAIVQSEIGANMQQQEVTTEIRRRAVRPPHIGPMRPNFVLACPDCGHWTGLLTLEHSWRCAECRAQWRLKMCRRCHRHLEMLDDGPYCQDAFRCGKGVAASTSDSH